jgi:2-dehydro-3-deoxy-D-gluconate 5-dehydrogenase
MNPNLFSLEGKIALVTGASRGLGQAMALGMAAAGADIAGLDRQTCSDTCEQVRALGRRFHDVTLDLRRQRRSRRHEPRGRRDRGAVGRSGYSA